MPHNLDNALRMLHAAYLETTPAVGRAALLRSVNEQMRLVLSKAEVRVLRAIAQTGDYKAAAVLLECVPKTVENHVVRIHRKMGESSTVRCVLIAERAGLLVGVT